MLVPTKLPDLLIEEAHLLQIVDTAGRTGQGPAACVVARLTDDRVKIVSSIMGRTPETVLDGLTRRFGPVEAAYAEPETDDVMVAGQTNLMESGELGDMDKLRRLFEAFNEKRDLLHLLDHSLGATGIQIFIGEESGYNALGDCSVITAPYGAGEEFLGVLGVIGPTRMAYERVIPVVDITARLLSAALNKQH